MFVEKLFQQEQQIQKRIHGLHEQINQLERRLKQNRVQQGYRRLEQFSRGQEVWRIDPFDRKPLKQVEVEYLGKVYDRCPDLARLHVRGKTQDRIVEVNHGFLYGRSKKEVLEEYKNFLSRRKACDLKGPQERLVKDPDGTPRERMCCTWVGP